MGKGARTLPNSYLRKEYPKGCNDHYEVIDSEIILRLIDTKSEYYLNLKKNIKDHGIITPIIVREVNDEYEIIDGLHRLVAARELGINDIPYIIVTMTDEEAVAARYYLNKPLSLERIEKRRYIIRLFVHYPDYTLTDFAELISESETEIIDIFELNNVPVKYLYSKPLKKLYDLRDLIKLNDPDVDELFDSDLPYDEFTRTVMARIKKLRAKKRVNS